MRPIDADALINELHKEWDNCEIGNATWTWIREVVRDQPPVPAAPLWHRVEDELPPPNKTVLVCKIWRDVNGEPHKVITMDSFTISPSDSVIAWMPLPEPPKEEEHGN